MGMQPQNIHHNLYQGPKMLADPGNGNTIRAIGDLSICELVSTEADETRTLANPTKAGIRLTMRMLTDGGDVIVTASNGLTVSLNTYVVFDDAGDFLSLISVTKTVGSSTSAATYRWQTLYGNIGVTVV